MKFGLRTPSIKRSIKARTTGRLKREIKRSIIPFYGQRGMGWIKNPKKALYNKVYNQTTFSVRDIFKPNSKPISSISIIIVGLFLAFLVFLGLASAKNSSDNSSNNKSTTVIERIVIESEKETSEKTTSETIVEAAIKQPTIASTTEKPNTTVYETTTEAEHTYILNNSTMKFHKPKCRGVKQMKEENKQEYTGTREEVIDMGYSPCGTCKP